MVAKLLKLLLIQFKINTRMDGCCFQKYYLIVMFLIVILGDYLIVALSTDEFNEIKGKQAYHNYETRKKMLEAILE